MLSDERSDGTDLFDAGGRGPCDKTLAWLVGSPLGSLCGESRKKRVHREHRDKDGADTSIHASEMSVTDGPQRLLETIRPRNKLTTSITAQKSMR